MDKKICLVYPDIMELPFFNQVNTSKEPLLLTPLGMLYIVSNSKKRIDVIDNRIEKMSDDELFNKLMNYDIIGFSGTIFEVKQALDVSERLIKEGKTTIYGGPNASANWELYLGKFSMILRGEAEEVFDKVVDGIDSPDKLKELGFSVKKKTWINNELFKIADLDKLNPPDRDAIKLNMYKRKEPLYLPGIYPVDTVSSSRGCPFDCYFCSSKSIWEKRYTYRSVDNVIDEIKHMKERYGTKGVYFREDNFTAYKKRVREFCKKIKSLNIKWMCESRADTLDEELIKEMKESGCDAIWFGIESVSNKTLEIAKRGTTIEKARKTISLCKKYGMRVGGSFMIGFPHETIDDMKRTIRKGKNFGLDNVFFSRIWAIPKSEMYDIIMKEGLNRYEYYSIVIPDTRHVHADVVTSLSNSVYDK